MGVPRQRAHSQNRRLGPFLPLAGRVLRFKSSANCDSGLSEAIASTTTLSRSAPTGFPLRPLTRERRNRKRCYYNDSSPVSADDNLVHFFLLQYWFCLSLMFINSEKVQ
jgi:hypothetical protein